MVSYMVQRLKLVRYEDLGKREKLLESMKNNPKDVPFEQIDALLMYYGCTRRQASKGSSHYFYTHPAVPYPVNIPRHKPVKAIYIKQALEMIDQIREVLDNE